MLTLDSFFLHSTQQRYGISGLEIITRPRYVFSHLDEKNRLITVARPVLVFRFGNAKVEKAMPMDIKTEWFQSERCPIATHRIYAECKWGTQEIESYIKKTVADLRDNQLVKGTPLEIHRSLS